MKGRWLCILFVLCSVAGFAQPSHSMFMKPKGDSLYFCRPLRVRDFFWFTPVGHSTQINGLALGLMATPLKENDQLVIHGLNVTIDPFVAIATFYTVFGTVFSPFIPAKYDIAGYIGNPHIFMKEAQGCPSVIHGLSIGTGNYGAEMRGVSINAFNSMNNVMEGVEVTTFRNLHYAIRGVMIGMFRNKTAKGKGLQIGLINNCREGRLVQIGLINKIGKRTIPFFNCSLKRKKKA